MDNIKVFEKLVKGLPKDQQSHLAEKIRQLTNRREHTDYLKAIMLGTYLNLTDEISLIGYITENVPKEVSPDGNYATTIRNEHNGKMIVGETDEIRSTMVFEHAPWY